MIDRQAHRQAGKASGQTKGWTGRRMDGLIDGQADRQTETGRTWLTVVCTECTACGRKPGIVAKAQFHRIPQEAHVAFRAISLGKS